MKVLVQHNYQVKMGVLQAGHYGVPQNRVRVFIWAAQNGLPLPEYPVPTHDFHIFKNVKKEFEDTKIL